MAQWTQAYVDSLPDTAFLFVAPGGKKVDGKTEPLSLRKLPYRDADGNLDHAHLANALARLDNTEGISADEKDAIRTKAQKLLDEDDKDDNKAPNKLYALPDEMIAPIAARITLDANGDLPQRFPVLTTGHWPNSIKGDFKVT